jgi:hypothetical protein
MQGREDVTPNSRHVVERHPGDRAERRIAVESDYVEAGQQSLELLDDTRPKFSLRYGVDLA